MAEPLTALERLELVRRIFEAGSRRAETDDLRALAAGFISELDQKIAAQRDADAACCCPCHQVIQPGLVPCPRCEQESDQP